MSGKEERQVITVDEFLSKYDPKVRNICFQLREIALELLPETIEFVYKPYNISYGTGESRADKDLIIYIAPLKDSVNLGFYRGVNLEDKKQLLSEYPAPLRSTQIGLRPTSPIRRTLCVIP